MPIHDQGYRRYRGGRAGGRAWLVIIKAGVRTMLGDRKFIVLLVASWIQFLVRAVQFYFAANFSQAAIIAPNAATFRDFFDKQDIFVFIVTVTLGASLIAQDRRVNALQIYLSKPLTRAEYIFGKLGILMTFLLFITWAPAVLLLGVQVMFAGNFSFVLANAYLLPAITLYSLLEIVMVSTSMLALSSLSTNSRFVGILYTALIFFGQALSGVLRFITGGTKLSWIAFGNDLAQVGDLIFRVPLRFDIPWLVSLLTIVGLVAVSGLILERRVRGVEIVA
jgi:ABC-2 type transport system permease protein